MHISFIYCLIFFTTRGSDLGSEMRPEAHSSRPITAHAVIMWGFIATKAVLNIFYSMWPASSLSFLLHTLYIWVLLRLLPQFSPAQSAAREPVSVPSSAQTLCNLSMVMGHELWIRFIHHPQHSHGNMHKFACEISGSSLTSNQGHDGWLKNVM